MYGCLLGWRHRRFLIIIERIKLVECVFVEFVLVEFVERFFVVVRILELLFIIRVVEFSFVVFELELGWLDQFVELKQLFQPGWRVRTHARSD